MSVRSIGRDRTRRSRGGKSRLRQAFEETLMENLSSALEGKPEAERILIGHKREMERLDRESARETADINRDLAATEELLRSENQTLDLLNKRKKRMEESTPPQPTEVVEGQIVESTRRVFTLKESQSKLRERQLRLQQDVERERKEQLEETRHKLGEVR